MKYVKRICRLIFLQSLILAMPLGLLKMTFAQDGPPTSPRHPRSAFEPGPIPFLIESQNDEELSKKFNIQAMRFNVELFTDKNLEEEASTILRTALDELYLQITSERAFKETHLCLEQVASQFPNERNPLVELRGFFLGGDDVAPTGSSIQWRRRHQQFNPRIFLLSFSEDQFEKFYHQVVFAYPNFYEHVLLKNTRPYLLIGVNQDVLFTPHPVMGNNIRFWKSMLVIGILQNLGVRESLKDLANSPTTHAANCIFFEGKVPLENRIIPLDANERGINP